MLAFVWPKLLPKNFDPGLLCGCDALLPSQVFGTLCLNDTS